MDSRKFAGVIRAAAFGAAIFWFFGAVLSPGQSAEAVRSAPGSIAAIEHFWTAYHGNDYTAIPQLQAELRVALVGDSNNPALYALLGATYFWHIGEYTRDPKPDPHTLQQDMPTAVQFFQ